MRKRRQKIHITTLGCEKNLVDSEAMTGYLNADKFEIIDSPENAEIVIINTCGFIQPAKEESIDAILEATELKKQGSIKKVLVAGCMSQRYKDEMIKELPDVDAFFGTEDYRNIASYLGQTHLDSIDKIYSRRNLTGPKHFAYLKISEGCDHECSFCAIPLMRGKHRSRSLEHILEEAKMLADAGARELILIAQDSTYWGKDLNNGQTITDLVSALEKIEAIQWIRVMYLYPNTIPPDYFDFMKNSQKLLNYVDIPLQHASGKMLKLMRRGGNKNSLEDLIVSIRNKVENIVIRTTFIVGHPGETEADFEELLDFIGRIKFNRIGAFLYSDEDHTASFEQKEKVPDDIKSERYNRLMEKQQEISLELNSKLRGKIVDVIMDEFLEESATLIGRSYGDAPEIDNEVIIENCPDGKARIGEIFSIKITDVETYELFGNIYNGVHGQ